MRLTGVLAITVLLAFLCVVGTPAIAQQGDDSDQPVLPADAPVAGEAEEKPKKEFALYVSVGYGATTANALNTSIQSSTSSHVISSLNFDQTWTKSAIGWKFANGKGDFRLVYNGYREDGYTFNSEGFEATYVGPVPGAIVQDPLSWWNLGVQNGSLNAVRTPPTWDSFLDDADGDGIVDADEVIYGASDIEHTIAVTDDLQGSIQFADFLYGRTFGGRRYDARWWAGIRRFTYEGNVLAAAWVGALGFSGSGFTDGTFLRLLNMRQTTEATGLTTSLESRFNFFDKRLQLYLTGQVAFMAMDLEVDTGEFFTVILVNGLITPADARLQATRDKDSWQTMGEAGLRIHLKNGLSFELAYNISGFLDVVLTPPEIQIPENQLEAGQGTTAIYNTQDIVTDGGRVGLSFQF
jgi:hypothetical protein